MGVGVKVAKGGRLGRVGVRLAGSTVASAVAANEGTLSMTCIVGVIVGTAGSSAGSENKAQ
jgi:hypothetical protein